jgi:hypothetical protein
LVVNDDALSRDTSDKAPAGSRTADGGLRARVPAAIRRRLTAEHAVVLALGLLVLVVHDVGYMLSQSFWTDEAWVAVTTRFPLSQLLATTNSTPIGWSVLLRMVTQPATQTSRLLPLAFAGGAVIIAYWFARRLGWRWAPASVAAGLTAAVGVLLVPAMLHRNDLKQYTADACLSLLILALTSRVEREWSRRGLAALSVAVCGGMLFSDAAAFVGIAAFVAVCTVELVRRRWRRLAEAVVIGLGTAVVMLGLYLAFDSRVVAAEVTGAAGFSQDYLPIHSDLFSDISFVVSHVASVGAYFGLGSAWLAIPLVVAGIITMFWLGRPATAVAVAVLWPEMLAMSAMKKYPFLDSRTSTFMFAVTVVVAAVGVVGVSSLLRRWFNGALAAGLVIAAVLLFAAGSRPYIRSHTIPDEGVRQQTRYVSAHDAPGDVIVVNMSSNWGFAYYWPIGRPSRRPDANVVQGYEAYFPDQPRIVVARNRDQAGVSAALTHALALARQRSSTRIWLVRTHVSTPELAAWNAALAADGLSAEPLPYGLSVVHVG